MLQPCWCLHLIERHQPNFLYIEGPRHYVYTTACNVLIKGSIYEICATAEGPEAATATSVEQNPGYCEQPQPDSTLPEYPNAITVVCYGPGIAMAPGEVRGTAYTAEDTYLAPPHSCYRSDWGRAILI